MKPNLLAKPNLLLTYKKACELALALEAADKSAQDLYHKSSTINLVNVSSTERSSTCHRCEGPYKAPECTFQIAKCHKCGKVGHIAQVYHAKVKSKVLEQQHSLQLDEESYDLTWIWHALCQC